MVEVAAPSCALCNGPSTVYYAPVTGKYFCEGCGPKQGMSERHRIGASLAAGSQASPFDSFASAVRYLVEGKAVTKGYRQDDDAKPGGKLHEFVSETFGGHSLGEIVYKTVRYHKKHDPEDLLKIAAWAYLVWANYKPEMETVVEDAGITRVDAILQDGYDETAKLVREEAIRAAQKHGYTDDPVRAVGIVVEEAGEAMQAALDATRNLSLSEKAPGGQYSNRVVEDLQFMVGELVQTAAVAIAYAARFRRI